MSDIEDHRTATELKTSDSGSFDVNGIGGWLVLPMLGMFASLAFGAWDLRMAPGTLQAAQTVGSIAQAAVLYAELIVQPLLQIVAPLVLLSAFFAKSRLFPRLFVIWLVVSLLYTGLDLLLVWTVFRQFLEFNGASFFDGETSKTVAQRVIAAFIWIPYMFTSVRVKNTFVN